MIRVLELPGVPAIETRVRLNGLTGVRQDHELDRMLDAFFYETLGLEGHPSWLLMDSDYFDQDDEGPANDERSEAEVWRDDGWDIRWEDGQQLQCLPSIRDALICIEEGHSPRSMMEWEVAIWQERKAEEAVAKPVNRAVSQSFLGLNRPSRRRA